MNKYKVDGKTIKSATEVQREEDRSEQQARAQFESIKAYVERLKHAQTCENENCEEGNNGGDYWNDAKEYHDADEARQAINEDALSVQIRSGWHTPGDKERTEGEYEILLCTGGPACRIIGDLSKHNESETARIEHQDWGTPWTEYRLTSDEKEIALEYARCFYFGE